MTELEELFADLWQVPRFAAGRFHEHRPPLDVFVTADPPELTIVVDVAGADPASIQLVLDGRRLLIAGERPGRVCVASSTAARSSTGAFAGPEL